MQWEQLEKEAIRCIKCGACQTVCPVFKELEAESTVARGKVNLIKAVIKGDVEAGSGFKERMSWCLACKACVENCPSGTQVDRLVIGARQKLVEDNGLPFLKKLIFRWGLRNRRLFDLSLNMGSIFQKIFFRTAPNGRGMLPRLPMGLDKRRLISPLAEQTFRNKQQAKIANQGAVKTVAFFTGCMINHVNPEIGEAVLKLLKHNGANVIIPKNQHCCGTPAYVNGDIETARELAKATVDHFSSLDVDAVITACGSCGLALRKEYPEILKGDSKYKAKAELLSSKTLDITEYLADSGLQGNLQKVNKIVTYHESCHLGRGLKVKEQPRGLIKSIPGIEFKEMTDPGRCCGAAGSFSLSHYELSMKINKHKVQDIADTGAEVLVTGCAACMMHIKDGLNRSGQDNIEVMHTAELIAAAYE
ncbi:MAG: (Fe-S)-binding protein [Peptococcaceae bacterium]